MGTNVFSPKICQLLLGGSESCWVIFTNQPNMVLRKCLYFLFMFCFYTLPSRNLFFIPKKNNQISVSFEMGERWRLNIREQQVSFQPILSKTEAFLKWFAAIVVSLASCSRFQQFISWAHLPAWCVWLQAMGEGGRPTKGKGALKPYLLFLFLFRMLWMRHCILFLPTIKVQYLPQHQHGGRKGRRVWRKWE